MASGGRSRFTLGGLQEPPDQDSAKTRLVYCISKPSTLNQWMPRAMAVLDDLSPDGVLAAVTDGRPELHLVALEYEGLTGRSTFGVFAIFGSDGETLRYRLRD